MEFKCDHCNKSYKSYQSRWNHIKRYHCNTLSQNSSNSSESSSNLLKNTQKSLKCKYCNKMLSRSDNLKRHESKCNKSNVKSTDKLYNDFKKKIFEDDGFKKEFLKVLKIHPKTLQKINKQLNNYGNINNFTVIALGKEKLDEVLTDKQKLKILKSCSNAPASLTNLIYSNPELEKYRNIYITNLSNDVGYIYDDEKKQYIVKLKSKIINQYSDERLWNIEAFYDELKGKLDDNVIKKIETLIQNYFNNDEENTKIKKELLISLYNNKVNVKEIYEKVNEIEL